MEKVQQHRPFITGFNGLRTLGVIGVILYHINPEIFAGGYLGVPIFFVLTGYLITDQILRSLKRRRVFDLWGYYRKRVQRLYPGLLLMLFSASAYIVLFQRNLLHNLRAIFVTNICNIYNFWQINHGQSYFERFANNESPFTHMWSLSIQGQFYFFWPIILIFLLKKFSKKTVITITLLLTTVSVGLMAFLYQPNVDPSRIYYGTDTRLFSIMIGCLLAFFWSTDVVYKKSGKNQRVWLNLTGTLSFVVLIYCILRLKDTQAFTYRGGMLLFSIAVAILAGVIAHPDSFWNKALTNPVFDEIGKISYGLYLYQFPVMIFFESKITNIADHRFLYPILEIVLIFLVSYLSYYLVERPLAKLDWHHLFVKTGTKYRQLANGCVSLIVCLIVIVGSAGLVTAGTDKKTDSTSHNELARKININSKQNQSHNKKLLQQKQQSGEQRHDPKQVAHWKKMTKKHPVNKEYQQLGLSQFDLQRGQDLPALAIGDSVMVDGSADLRKIFPQMVIDADVSRNVDKALELLQNYQTQNKLPHTLVVGMGTNGPVSPEQVQQVMSIAGAKRQVFWINVHVPTRSWEHPVNDVLQKQAAKYRNLKIIDWYDYCANHDSWFYGDQVHPNPSGARQYSTFVAQKILKWTKY
ncbi:acyltransferase family protein [Bombilactobacillus thymidiniphilus]|uniref:Acetyltransferase n=1 Tax=Bombilactobacillus thymidiniphilus TaxID=2923363 RepID=A0ABY4PDD2_9LACO|nr:acyltransferase family protein [Bombilactobacillus thymidiniphilus]UQS83735.1 acetyltransferase [Bombilactobacillus thymidiniphilus]